MASQFWDNPRRYFSQTIKPQWHYIVIQQIVILLGIFIYFTLFSSETQPHTVKRSAWDTRPKTEKCYNQNRTATLLALYLGILGADQWYARHWVLATFKLITFGGFGIWAIVDVTLWIVGGIYGTPGCPGRCSKVWAC